MADTARVGAAVVGGAVVGISDMPDFSGDHFTWEGSCWEAVADPDLLVATMDPSASPTAKEALTARIVQSMSVATKKLVVTEEAILNHATLIGQTVVDDINVQGKLIGTDGVFTGTVDFENINVTDEVLASRISGEHIYGTVIEGGLFKTSDALPGQVELADDAYVDHFEGGKTLPGLRITPIDTSETNLPAAIGPSEYGLTIFGGRSTSGGSSIMQCHPDASFMRTLRPDGAEAALIQASSDASFMQATKVDGTVGGQVTASREFAQMVTRGSGEARGVLYANPTSAYIRTVNANNVTTARLHADATESYIYSRAGGSQRYLTVDSTGVWVKTNKSGSWEWYNLEETANDSGWINFNAHSGISTGNSPALRLKGGIVWAQGYVTRPAGWPSGWTRIAGSFATWLRPTRDILRYGATTATQRQLVRMTSTGYLEVWWSAAAPGDYQVDLSVLSYPNT